MNHEAASKKYLKYSQIYLFLDFEPHDESCNPLLLRSLEIGSLLMNF